jgi:hypothetical protein
MTHLVFLLEEESSKEFLENLLPRVFPECTFRCIPFQGKSDLESNIIIKLRGYNVPNSKFIILHDQDSSDCHKLKQKLQDLCILAFKPEALIRIACKELESWYFGDLSAVEKALQLNNLQRYSRNRKYRVPDSIINPKQELKKITDKKYKQVSSSKYIGKYINYESNTSHSFNVFINGLKKIIY